MDGLCLDNDIRTWFLNSYCYIVIILVTIWLFLYYLVWLGIVCLSIFRISFINVYRDGLLSFNNYLQFYKIFFIYKVNFLFYTYHFYNSSFIVNTFLIWNTLIWIYFRNNRAKVNNSSMNHRIMNSFCCRKFISRY